MNLFEFTKVLFEKPREWFQLLKSEKKKHFYMTNQFMAIVFPIQAQLLNHIKINPEATMDFWQRFMRQRYQKVPFWMYIKGRAKRKEEKEKKTISQNLINLYCKTYSIDPKIIQDGLLHYPEEIIKELKSFEKMIKEANNK